MYVEFKEVVCNLTCFLVRIAWIKLAERLFKMILVEFEVCLFRKLGMLNCQTFTSVPPLSRRTLQISGKGTGIQIFYFFKKEK